MQIQDSEERYEKIKDFLNTHDHFARNIGIRIEEVKAGYAKAVMELTDFHINGAKVIQGGAIFTLADFAFAGASNTFGPRSTAMNATIAFLRPGCGKQLIAEAKEVSHGHRTCLFDVEVKNDQGKLIAKLQISGFLFDGESIV